MIRIRGGAEMRERINKRWVLQTKRGDFQGIGEKYGISPVAARCIVNRGISGEREVEEYLRGTLDQISSPWLMKDMEKAVEVIVQKRGECAAIASDFDCDGIFSAYILKKGFEECGIQSRIYTPDRVAEGYGLNCRIVDEAAAQGAGFLITCDNGIAAGKEILYAKEKGMPVIVTDHHEVQEEPPKADAVVDPRQKDCHYPFSGLCGAGVAFQLVSALYERMGIPVSRREELLVFVAFATVADVMELQGENRILVREGLKRLPEVKNEGLRALVEVQGLSLKEVRAYHIGFVLGPCFNAAGRIDTVEKAFALLEAKDREFARAAAEELKELNDTRKEMTEEAARRAFDILEKSGELDRPIHIVLLTECHESLAGLVASRMKERYHHPAIVFTEVEGGMVKGSGRSIESYHMFQHLMDCRDLMARFGGHRMAAGMTLPKENLPELVRRLNENSGLVKEDFVPVLNIDVPLPIGKISEDLLLDLQRLEPFGKGNPKPVFAEQHFQVLWGEKRGKNQNVLAMRVKNVSGTVMNAVCFEDVEGFEALVVDEWGDEELQKMYAGKENQIDLGMAYYPSVNEYRDFRTLEIIVTDFCRIGR